MKVSAMPSNITCDQEKQPPTSNSCAQPSTVRVQEAAPFAPKRLLITGGAGFVGSNFAHWVSTHHPHVHMTVLDALTYAGNKNNLRGIPAGQLRFVHGNILDASLVDQLVAAADAVVHFAAETHNDRAITAPAPFVETNITGTFCLLEAARAHNVRFHHVSTDEVFGSIPYPPATPQNAESAPRHPAANFANAMGGGASAGARASDTFANTINGEEGSVTARATTRAHGLTPFTEASPLCPNGPYAASKAASDLLVLSWQRTYGVTATVSNCGNNFGPRQHVEKFIPRQVTNILQGRAPRLYGAGRNVRDWIFVDDHSAAVWACLTRGRVGERYVVGAGCQLENAQVVAEICRLMGWPASRVENVADRPGHDSAYALDASKLRAQTGWAPAHTDFSAALSQTIDWYMQNAAWWDQAKIAAEANYATLDPPR
jgi:dTDP-glucose 4,6-dehydratase